MKLAHHQKKNFPAPFADVSRSFEMLPSTVVFTALMLCKKSEGGGSRSDFSV
jgi:hypothetical protein